MSPGENENATVVGGALREKANVKSASEASSAERSPALDFTKGALVLCMVAYHCINYFRHDKDILRYLRFLPPSFILITGFLITAIYFAKYDLAGSRLPRRLFARGFKLFLIFVGLNLVVSFVFSRNYNNRALGLESFTANLGAIFLTGNGRAAVFEVLLPISYLLMLSAVLVRMAGLSRYCLPVFCALSVLGYLLLDHYGYSMVNFEMLSMGLLGMALGLVPLVQINCIANRLSLVFFSYLAYLILISSWFPLYKLNIIGVCLTLLLMYGIGSKFGARGWIQQQVVLLGKYSLVAYIIQIGILQALFRGMKKIENVEFKLVFGLIVTTSLMIFAVRSVDAGRRRFRWLDSLYRVVFA